VLWQICLSHFGIVLKQIFPQSAIGTTIFEGYRCYKTLRRTPQLWHQIHRGGENLRFLTKVAVYLETVQIGPWLVWITNRKSQIAD